MLHVLLLGQQAIADEGTGSVRTRSSRTVALLAFLAVHAGLPQTRQRIAGLFWPDSTDAQALTNLRLELHHLRHVLGDYPSTSSGRLPWRRRMTVPAFWRMRPVPWPSTAASSCRGCTTTG